MRAAYNRLPLPVVVWIAFILLCLAWGSSYVYIKVAVRQISPVALVGLRVFVGALFISAVSAMRRQDMRLTRKQGLAIVVAATINTSIPFLLISWGELTVPSGLASVLNSTVPIFSVVLAAIVLRDEPLALPRLGGVVIGFVGVVVLVSHELSHGLSSKGLVGQAAIVLASICYAVGAVFVRRTLRGVPSLTIGTWALIIAATETMALTLVFSRPPVLSLRPETILAVLWLGILGSGFAYILSYFILEHWGASRYTFVAYSLPAVGLTLGVLFLHEVLTWRILVGSLLVIMGIVLASIRRRAAEPARERVAGRQAVR